MKPKRREVVCFKCTIEERSVLDGYAKSAGLSVHAFLQTLVLDDARCQSAVEELRHKRFPDSKKRFNDLQRGDC